MHTMLNHPKRTNQRCLPASGAHSAAKCSDHKKLFLLLVLLAGAFAAKAQTFPTAANDQFPFKVVTQAPLSASCTTPPADSLRRTGMVDVTKPPYNADKTGQTDATQAFRDALARKETFLYIPNGTYLISDSVGFSPLWATAPNGLRGYGGDYLQMWGESRNGVILKLKDHAPGFNDPGKPKAFFNTGGGSPDRFNNSIWNVTFEIGTGNPGAIGLRHYLNNSGGLYNVTIRTRGQGKIGLDKSYNRANGPSLTKDVLIEGFDIGIKTDFSVESEVYEHVTLRNQTQYGMYNARQVLSIRGLKVENCGGPALYNGAGFVNLLDGNLAGTGAAAIVNGENGKLLVRNLSTSGYTQAISDPQKPLTQTSLGGLYLSDAGIGTDGNPNHNVTTLNLPVKETPVVPWDDPATWVDPVEFGATANGVCRTTVACLPCDDDSDAIQRAIDATQAGGSRAGATTLFISGDFRIYKSIRLRGSIRRVIGPASNGIGAPGNGKNWDGTPVGTTWIVEGGTHPVVEFQNINTGWPEHQVPYIESSSGRTIVIKNSQIGPSINITNGEVFIESSAINRVAFTSAKVWARQLDPESNTNAKLTLDGTTYWGLGLKTEKANTIILARNQSKVEQFGGYIYTTDQVDAATPMLRIENSEISISMYEYLGYYAFSKPYMILVSDVKGSLTATVNRGGTITAPTYPATWSQCNDGTTGCTDGKVGSSYTLYRNTASNASDITLRTADTPSGTVAGLDYRYYEGNWSSLPDFDALTAAEAGTVANFDLTPKNRTDNFGFRFTGYVHVPADGTYTFYTSSDDGSKLYIGSTQVVNNDGLHGARERSGTIGLKAGKHAIAVTFFEATVGEVLTVSYSGPTVAKQAIPASALSRSTASGFMRSEKEKGEKLLLYPNPVTNGSITVRPNAAGKDAKVAVTLTDVTGRIVYKTSFVSRGTSHELKIGKLKPGMYTIRMNGPHTDFTSKVIVE
jgi:hypothetical protein